MPTCEYCQSEVGETNEAFLRHYRFNPGCNEAAILTQAAARREYEEVLGGEHQRHGSDAEDNVEEDSVSEEQIIEWERMAAGEDLDTLASPRRNEEDTVSGVEDDDAGDDGNVGAEENEGVPVNEGRRQRGSSVLAEERSPSLARFTGRTSLH